MFTSIRVKLNERTVVFKHGLPLRALAPGRHVLWQTGLTEQRWSTDQLVFQALPEVRAILPGHWFAEVTIAPRERGILWKDGSPKLFLRPGTHRYWTVDPSVRLEVISVDAPIPELTTELVAVFPRDEYVDVVVREHERGLEYVQGKLARTLAPGRYAFWSNPQARVEVQVVDIRRVQVAIVGQELMTRDKVTLRLSLTVEYAIEDAALATHAVASAKDSVYLLVQLAAREYLSGVTLDQLLEGRDAMTRYLEQHVVPEALRFGVRVERVGVKDVVLPGEMKTLLNRVIEAEKEAAANVILRREETAATRSLANTARVIAEQPVLLRLKELEAMKEIASRIHEVRVVVGADGLKTLLPAGLLGPANGNGSANHNKSEGGEGGAE
jgi:regulator of protease activity HflC (stomatin/prohibitin superfamily)